MSETLSLFGEESNLADGEKRARTTECCRATDEEQDPARTIISWSRTITTGTLGRHHGTARAFHTELEFRGGIWVLHPYRPELISGSCSGYVGGHGPHYLPGIHPSYGPHVGPSSSAHFDYENPVLWSTADLSTCITTLGTQQQQMQETMAHNTQLTQRSWELICAMQYDVSNIFILMGLNCRKYALEAIIEMIIFPCIHN